MMNARKRFMIGGAGAMMPVLITLLSVDFAAMIDERSGLTLGHIVGFSIRYCVLFLLGGFIAYLHTEEDKPYKVFQLGIAAPALITSFITANGMSSINPATEMEISRIEFSLISSAHAQPYHSNNQGGYAQPNTGQHNGYGSFFHDVIRGFSGSVYGNAYQYQQQAPAYYPGAQPKAAAPPSHSYNYSDYDYDDYGEYDDYYE